jgi:hypothetical protein
VRNRLGLLLMILMLAGCRYYYTKPGATEVMFAGDHAACIKEVGRFSAADTTRAYVATNDYRGCMQLRGWSRAEQTNPGPEWYRGIEENGVYAADTPPPNRDSAENFRQMREHCRQIHRTRPADYDRCVRSVR